MKITTLLIWTGLAICAKSYGQVGVYMVPLTQPDCGLETPVGDLQIVGTVDSGADSVEVNLSRSANSHETYWLAGSFDTTVTVTPGYYQASVSPWIDGFRDTTFYSAVVEMNSCMPFVAEIEMPLDTNCGDLLAPLRLTVSNDQGLYMYAKLFNSGELVSEFEAPDDGFGPIDTILYVSGDTYDFHAAEYFQGMLYNVDWSNQVVLYPCSLSTGVSEHVLYSAELTYEVVDSRGILVRSGREYGMNRLLDLSKEVPGMYIIRVMQEGKPVSTTRRFLEAW